MMEWNRQLRRDSALAGHWADRLEAELSFAEALCGLQPAHAAGWRPLLEQAAEAAADGVRAGGASAMAEATRAAEAILAPIKGAAKSYTIHCAGHAHIDMNWMWSWPETVAVTIDTFATVLKLMDEFPGFRFSQSQASVYAIVERHRPDMLRQIARRVKQGRWEVTASHWVETDKNLASAESLCRHLLHTRRAMRRLFGLSPEDVPIDWSPDTFGHAATVPTYLARGGVKYLYLHRPGLEGPERPPLFWWAGPDGSRVLVKNDAWTRSGYNGQIRPDIWRELVTFASRTGLRDHMFVYGVGDHGGGPTRRDLAMAADMAAWPIFPTVRFGTAREFFELAAGRGRGLPVLDVELNFEFAGCYTTQSLIKKNNRHGENRLLDAETAAACGWLAAGCRYPAEDLAEGWQDILFSHFHDILPGSGVRATRHYNDGLFQKTMAMTGQVEALALRTLAGRVDTGWAAGAAVEPVPSSRIESGVGAGVGYRSADGMVPMAERSSGDGPRPFLVFNPTGWSRDEVVQATVWNNAPAGARPMKERTYRVRRPDGSAAAAQTVAGGNYWGHEYATVAFPARVPSLGYAQVAVEEGEADAVPGGATQIGLDHACRYSMRERHPEGLENEHIRLEIDPVGGGIRLLRDKRTGVDLVTPELEAPALEFEVERPHAMSSWLVHHTGAPAERPVLVDLRRLLRGPYAATLAADLSIRESRFTVTYELRAGDPRVYLSIAGTWFQRGDGQTGVPVLNFALPLALSQVRARYEIPFGAIDRELTRGEEVPALQWAQVCGITNDGAGAAGCLVLNDCKHGHSLEGNTLRVTLIRSSYEPDILPEIGQHEIRLAIVPFAGAMDEAGAIREGAAFNRPIRLVGTDVHPGSLPRECEFVTVAPAGVMLSAAKKAEDAQGLILRVLNPGAKRVTARIALDPSWAAAFAGACEVDLLERPLEKGSARMEKGRVTVSVPARSFATVRLDRRRASR